MNVVVISGSPHENGASTLLVEAFAEGAKEAGNEVFIFNAGRKEVHSCMACEVCHKEGNGCRFKDAMEELNGPLLASDAVIFASPIYYYDVTPQLRSVIGRFYANNKAMHRKRRSALLLVCGDEVESTPRGAAANYDALVKRLEWDDAGTLMAYGCVTPEDIKASDYLKEAYRLGLTI